MKITEKAKGKSGSAGVIIHVKVQDYLVHVLSTYDKTEYDDVIVRLLKQQIKKRGL